MADKNEAADVRGDYTIAELRGMLGEQKATPAAEEGKEKSKPEAESGRDSGTEKKPAGERGEDGKFKSKEEAEKAESGVDKDLPEGAQKRINKAVAKQREAERKAEQLARENEELKKPKTEQPKKEQPKAEEAKASKKPQAGDFTSYEEYVEALTDWKVEQKDAAREKAASERKAAEEAKTRKSAWDAKVDQAREKYGDFDEVLKDAGETPISRAMHNAIAESDIGPELAYFLATHEAEAARIAKLTPYAAVKELGKIEDRLSEAPADKTADKTPAEDKDKKAKKELPKPPRNLGGGATPKEPKLDDPDLPFSEFKRIAAASLKR